jgi:undecaprenyl-diphosphatase
MTTLDILILSLIQGLTEFLPVSSSGHLLLGRYLFGIPDTEGLALDAFLHLGTLLALLIYFWHVWWGIVRSAVRADTEGRDKRQLLAKIALATLPGAVIGYLWRDELSHILRSPTAIAWSLLVTALLLWIADRFPSQQTDLKRARFNDAFFIGVAQAVALIPAVSRSGITIAAGRWRGLSRSQAATFSFLIAAPIIAGAGLLSLPAVVNDPAWSWPALVLGFVVACVSGLGSLWLFFKLLQRVSFTPFVVYLVVLSVGILGYGLL